MDVLDSLVLIRALKESLTESPLALAEDADYFRSLYKKKEPLQRDPPAGIKTFFPPPVAPIVITQAAEKPPVFKEAPVKRKETNPLFSLFSIIAPDFPLIHTIPNDDKAKKRASRWKTKNQAAPISILSFQEPSDHQELLAHLTVALDVYFGPASLIEGAEIEKEKQWEAFLSSQELKWVVCCDYTLWQLHDLMRYFKETPTTGQRRLGNIPLFLLPDLTLYIKDPLLKRSLWKAVCQICS